MNPDKTKLSDCHNFVTDSTNPAQIRYCCCGQICTWHSGEPADTIQPIKPATKRSAIDGSKDGGIQIDSDFKPILISFNYQGTVLF